MSPTEEPLGPGPVHETVQEGGVWDHWERRALGGGKKILPC